MKTSWLTTSSFLLLLFSTKLLLSCSALNEPVVDINNNTVTSNLQYYIETRSDNGSISLFGGMNGTVCPFDVIKEPEGGMRNLTKIFPYDGSTIVTESADLNVKFVTQITYCQETEFPIWKVGDDSVEGKRPILTSDKFEEDDSDTWFRLERIGINKGAVEYKFVHCTSDGDCNDVGYIFEEGAYRLFIDRSGGQSLYVVFVPEGAEIIKLVTSN